MYPTPPEVKVGGRETALYFTRSVSYILRGLSSIGRAFAWHAKGQGFKSPRFHWAQRALNDPCLPLPGYKVGGAAARPKVLNIEQCGCGVVETSGPSKPQSRVQIPLSALPVH